MHELSLAESLVRILGEEAKRHQLSRIRRFKLRVGALRGVVPELLETCLGFVTAGTAAEGATPDLELVPGRARCVACGHEHAIDEILFFCPACGRLGGEVIAGRELSLVELEGE